TVMSLSCLPPFANATPRGRIALTPALTDGAVVRAAHNLCANVVSRSSPAPQGAAGLITRAVLRRRYGRGAAVVSVSTAGIHHRARRNTSWNWAALNPGSRPQISAATVSSATYPSVQTAPGGACCLCLRGKVRKHLRGQTHAGKRE